MTTLNIHFSLEDGTLRTDDQVLAAPGLKRQELDLGLGRQMTVMDTGPGFVVYEAESLVVWGQRFGGGVRFFKDLVHGVTLTLENSKVAALGYDATENDLLAEKNVLTKLLTKNLGRPPSSTSLGANVFEFVWGGVVARADLKSTWCGIEIWYK